MSYESGLFSKFVFSHELRLRRSSRIVRGDDGAALARWEDDGGADAPTHTDVLGSSSDGRRNAPLDHRDFHRVIHEQARDRSEGHNRDFF